MAAITNLHVTILDYSEFYMLVIFMLLLLSGSVAIFFNFKCLKSHPPQLSVKIISSCNIMAGISGVLASTAVLIDIVDYNTGPPYIDGFTLTFDWDIISYLMLGSYLLYVLCLKVVVLCVVQQAKSFEGASGRVLVGWFSSVPWKLWIVGVFLYTVLEIVYRFISGIGVGPEFLGDVKLITNENNFISFLVCLLLPLFLPCFIGVFFACLSHSGQATNRFANLTTLLSVLTISSCTFIFYSDVLLRTGKVYYPLQSFFKSVVLVAMFGATFPLVFGHFFCKVNGRFSERIASYNLAGTKDGFSRRGL